MSDQTPDEWAHAPQPLDDDFAKFLDNGDGTGTVGVTSPGAVLTLEQPSTQIVRMVILRACRTCGGRTVLDETSGKALCPAGCGEAISHDIGVVSASYNRIARRRDVLLNPMRNTWFRLVRRPAANRRIRKANRTVNL